MHIDFVPDKKLFIPFYITRQQKGCVGRLRMTGLLTGFSKKYTKLGKSETRINLEHIS